MCGNEKSKLPFIACLTCPPALVPVLCLHILSHLVPVATDQEKGIRELKQPAQGHTAKPGVESRTVWPENLCSFCWVTLLSWAQDLLEMTKEWAQLCLCLAEHRKQLPTLRPTASSSQLDQRFRGQARIYLFLPLLA